MEINETYAEVVYRAAEDQGRRALETLLPQGFRVLGSGGSRTAVLAPDGLVYKVGSHNANIAEVNKANHIGIGVHVLEHITARIPEVVNVDNWDDSSGGWRASINVMEYANGVPTTEIYGDDCTCGRRAQGLRCYTNVWTDLQAAFGLFDMWSGNVHHNETEDVFVVIDMGE